MSALSAKLRNSMLDNLLGVGRLWRRELFLELRGPGGTPAYRVPVTATQSASGKVVFEEVPVFTAPEAFTIDTCWLVVKERGVYDDMIKIEGIRPAQLLTGESLKINQFTMKL